MNSFFFRTFAGIADVQFEVDTGKYPTNVTRLERMIRDADAFLGIYPFELGGEAVPSIESLKQYARYFRLELDLISRSSVPALIFTDSRYGNVLATSASIMHESFDINEVQSRGAKPSMARFAQAFADFANRVVAAKNFRLSEHRFDKVRGRVGFLIPQDGGPEGYAPEHIRQLKATTEQAGFDPIVMDWPVVLTPRLIGQLRSFDWVVVDVGYANLSGGIVGYLHGAFVPCMRLMKVQNDDLSMPAHSLYDGVDVGYRKDILRWTDQSTLEAGFKERLKSLTSPTRRMSTLDEALDYFLEATRIKEPIFISYAGEDQGASEEIRSALRNRFQNVFDYRDGKSIPAGKEWLGHIYDQIQRSTVGIPLFSSEYFSNGNCMHELEKMIALKDEGRMQIFPVKLNEGERLKMPPAIDSTQYWRLWEHKSAAEFADFIVANLPEKIATKQK